MSRYRVRKLERSRDLFEDAIQACLPSKVLQVGGTESKANQDKKQNQSSKLAERCFGLTFLYFAPNHRTLDLSKN